jgi:hypothetical protein
MVDTETLGRKEGRKCITSLLSINRFCGRARQIIRGSCTFGTHPAWFNCHAPLTKGSRMQTMLICCRVKLVNNVAMLRCCGIERIRSHPCGERRVISGGALVDGMCATAPFILPVITPLARPFDSASVGGGSPHTS